MSTYYPQNSAGYPHITVVIHRLMHNPSTGGRVTRRIPASTALRLTRSRRQPARHEGHSRGSRAGLATATGGPASRGRTWPAHRKPALPSLDSALTLRMHHSISSGAGKYNCLLLRDDLPWRYDDKAATQTSRVHEPDLAA